MSVAAEHDLVRRESDSYAVRGKHGRITIQNEKGFRTQYLQSVVERAKGEKRNVPGVRQKTRETKTNSQTLSGIPSQQVTTYIHMHNIC